jgi:hypothetical protein
MPKLVVSRCKKALERKRVHQISFMLVVRFIKQTAYIKEGVLKQKYTRLRIYLLKTH